MSRRMSFVLRHDPGSVGLTLDASGWVEVAALAKALSSDGGRVWVVDIELVAATSDKQRFAIDSGRIRANQGHSIPVDLALDPAQPPRVLWHGTHSRALAAILHEGLRRGRRHHVHLSETPEVARLVGARRGTPVVLRVDAAAMHRGGAVFYRSHNGVWLTESVPPEHLSRAH
ncbi:RNA 2'-phosphotransferase [Actinopolymorpha alba]|uniref:RNA 2'-phosphotransferase n=1 Tax=Actinopolymorpha alba TaxID=533267 RepID=UPI00307CC1E9